MKLAHALIAKSIAETILVSALAVSFFFSTFPPYFHGWSEVTSHAISGWAVNDHESWARVEVQLFVDGSFVASSTANQARPDVVVAGWAKDQWHGYEFHSLKLEPGRHEARVYALHASSHGLRQTLQMVGDPIWFDVDSGAALHNLSERN